MKKIRIIITFLLIVVMVGCSSQPMANETKTDDLENKDKIEVQVADNTSQEEEANEVGVSEEAQIITNNDEDVTNETNNSEVDENKLDETSQGEATDSKEYQVLDLSELEDTDNYSTGLVFILQEEDIWRVVDRLGNIYRVSTSNEGIVPGIVNRNASVSKDEDGLASVSLTRDYETYKDRYIFQINSDIEKEFSTALLDAQVLADPASKIDSYTLNSVSSNQIGRGIRKVTMNYNVEPSAGATLWGDNQDKWMNRSYTYTIYGYESTWILPVKPPLYKDLLVDADQTAVTEEDSEQVIASEEDSEQVAVTSDFNVNKSQKILAELNGKVYYSEKELLAQSGNLVGTDSYEHNIFLYVFDSNTGKSRQIVKGDKNGNYNLIKVYNNKMFLMVTEEKSISNVLLAGISYVNFDDLSYRSLYKGDVAMGITIKDKTYIFTNDNLIEIDLVKGNIRLASDLPKHLDLTRNSIKVISFEDQILTVEISYATEAITYTIDVVNGKTTLIDSFIF